MTHPVMSKPFKDANIEYHARIGVMLATFDPITLEHDSIIKSALAIGNIDYLVVIPNDFTFHKPKASRTDFRMDILAHTYAADENILTLDPYGYGFPQSRGLIKYIRDHHCTTRIVGIGLWSDQKTTIQRLSASYLMPVDEWVIFAPDLSDPDLKKFTQDGIKVVEHKEPQSSSLVRDYLSSHSDFYDMSDDGLKSIPEDELALSFKTKQYIRDYKILFDGKYLGGCVRDPLYNVYLWGKGCLLGFVHSAG